MATIDVRREAKDGLSVDVWAFCYFADACPNARPPSGAHTLKLVYYTRMTRRTRRANFRPTMEWGHLL